MDQGGFSLISTFEIVMGSKSKVLHTTILLEKWY